MANFRCFDSANVILDAQERSASLKRSVIQRGVACDLALSGGANPVKTNGYTYNSNLTLRPRVDQTQVALGQARGCLVAAASYALRSNYTVPPAPLTQSCTDNKSACAGNSLTVEGGGTYVVGAGNEFNDGVVDPSFVLFYEPCFALYANTNLI